MLETPQPPIRFLIFSYIWSEKLMTKGRVGYDFLF